MATVWTSDQKKAIETNGRNILVSAAAGSGKTAVLVERIIRKITAPDSSTDIDHLVVVTFTKAAAAEMKQRIRKRVDELIEEAPDNERLQRQLALIDNAPISTIDSFCLNIIRNYFADIDIDPGFKIADTGEIELMENDVMNDMLEEYYASHDKDFYDFVDAYTTDKSDAAVSDIILKLYNYARSYPWPNEWYDANLKIYDVNCADDLNENEAVKYLVNYIKYRLKNFDEQYEQAAKVCTSSMGPEKYLAAINEDHASIKMLLEADDIERIGQLAGTITFSTLGKVSSKDTSEEKKEYVKDIRASYKDFVRKELQGKIFTKSMQEMADDIKNASRFVKVMIDLAKDFESRMQKEKRSRNIIEFNDMEHMALDVLVKRQDGRLVYTQAADALSEYYDEIYIDEYQDSNMLQEVILTAVSKGRFGEDKNNVYMVGDVKQSIYKFRMACPKLFMEKYNEYSESLSEPFVKILLQANFRSRANVLESANDVFKVAMTEEFSGIRYDEKAQLNPEFEYPGQDGVLDPSTEIHVIKKDDSGIEKEGRKIADIIKQLVSKKADGTYNVVYDKDSKSGYRRIRYSDIVVLLRTSAGWADTFVNALMNEDIPAYSDSAQGYFNVREIKLVLNYLAVIDNPLQDIPMAAVMLSYFGGFNTDELALIRNIDKNGHLFSTMQKIDEIRHEVSDALENPKLSELDEVCEKIAEFPDELIKKISTFIEEIDRMRQMNEILSVNDLLWNIIYNTGYYDYVATMPAGERRQANLDVLLSRAAAFEKTSYSGLFNFLRYIDKLQKFDIDFGEASVLGENDDLVRIMTIHKSKGLEFPVVILAGMGKKMNQQDASGAVILDSDIGIGTSLVDVDLRVKKNTLVKQAVSKKIIQENISEELRVLYVAMTRAREKLIMTGIVDKIDSVVDKWGKMTDKLCKNAMYSYADILSFTNYFDIVMPVAGLPDDKKNGNFSVNYVSDDNTDEQENNHESEHENKHENERENKQENKQENPNDSDGDSAKEKYDASSDKENKESKESRFSNSSQKTVPLPDYPYEATGAHRVKVTVSELKKMQHDADFEETDMAIDAAKKEKDPQEEYIPNFISGKQTELEASDRGTAYHRVMECLDYNMTDSGEQISECIKKMLEDEKIDQNQADCIDVNDIFTFVQSPIGQRVKKAFLSGKIKREQPFVFGTTQPDSDETLLVQGIIDLYIKEGDDLVIVDYKTDRVSKDKAGEAELVKRYAIQLDYYAKALEQLTGLTVKEKIIYSFTLGRQIIV